MALIECCNCGKNVPYRALHCMQCGVPVGDQQAKPSTAFYRITTSTKHPNGKVKIHLSSIIGYMQVRGRDILKGKLTSEIFKFFVKQCGR